MADSAPILILTAGFGDGHNSAARSIAEAVRRVSGGRTEAVVVDLFEDAAPVTGAFYKWCYRQMITHVPALWSWLFQKTQKGDFTKLWWDRFVGVQVALEKRLREHRPAVVVMTYPIYPYFLDRVGPEVPYPQRVLMAVTDSITIHPIWLHVKVDRLYVTDEFSREIALRGQTAAVPVEVTGFPVAPGFADFEPRPAGPGLGLKVLYFATTAQRHVRLTLRGLMENLPHGAHLTVVMGRSESRLSPVVQEFEAGFPDVSITRLGWTREVPRLLMEHDVVISKAGGATVHECFAAGVPVVVNYIIPGQEEGNAELLERLGCGCRSMFPEETGRLLAGLVADGRVQSMREAMARNRRPDGAVRIAREVLEELAKLEAHT